jgi:hypothetical protein
VTQERHDIKCEVCGQFIRSDDIAAGKAIHYMVMPDSDRSQETFETLCPKHNTPENRYK